QLATIAASLVDSGPDGDVELRLATMEIAAELYETLSQWDDASKAYKLLFDLLSATTEPSEEIDRPGWRAPRGLALASKPNAPDPIAHDLIQQNLADRERLVGDYCVGYYVDELRSGLIDYKLGETLGLAGAIERTLDRLEKTGRTQSEDALFGLD